MFKKNFVSIVFNKTSILIDAFARKFVRSKYTTESTTKKYLLNTQILERKISQQMNRVFYALALILFTTCLIAVYSDVKYQKTKYTEEQSKYVNQLSIELNEISKQLSDNFHDYSYRIQKSQDNTTLVNDNELTLNGINNSSFYGLSKDKTLAIYGEGEATDDHISKGNKIKTLNNFKTFYYIYKAFNWLDGVSYISKDHFIVSSPISMLEPYKSKIFSTSAFSFSNKFVSLLEKSNAKAKRDKWATTGILSGNLKDKKYNPYIGYLYPISTKGDDITDGVLVADINMEKIFSSNMNNLDFSKAIDSTNIYILDYSGKIIAGYDVKQKHMISEKQLYADPNRILENDILSPKYMTNHIATTQNTNYTTFIKHSYYAGLTIVYSVPETNLLLKYISMSSYIEYIILFVVSILLLMICSHILKNLTIKPVCRIVNHITALNDHKHYASLSTKDTMSFWQGRLRYIFSILRYKHNEVISLSIQASIDSETQLPKRDKFIAMVKDALDQTSTEVEGKVNINQESEKISTLNPEDTLERNSVVIVFNIANFSRLSTIYSAEIIDTLIKQFASSLLLFSNSYENLQNNQHYIFSRLTSTKFCAFIQVSGSVDVESVVNQLATSLSAPVIIPNGDTLILKIYMGASVILTKDIFNPEKAQLVLENNIQKAGIALSYAAEYDTPVKYANEDILAIESYNKDQKKRLLHAINTKSFDMVFQPYFDIGTKSIKGIEALIRWDKSDIMPISTSQIISLAKQYNLVTEIDKILFEKIEESSSIFNAIPFPDKPYVLSLNVSVAYFFSPEFSAFINRLHKNLDGNKWVIAIEIHEDLMYDNIINIKAQIARLRQQNIIISLDNFGAGRASLEALTKVEIDTIKLSPTITTGLHDETYIKHIISMLRHLKELKHIQIVAVGLNSALTLKQLQDLGIDMIQSYQIGKITDLHETIEVISDQKEVKKYFDNEILE